MHVQPLTHLWALPLAFLLVLLALYPALALESGTYEVPAKRIYETALQMIEHGEVGDFVIARALFEECEGYEDSTLYIDYIEGVAALDGEDFTNAIRLLSPLADEDFLDAQVLLSYVRARREEAAGNFIHAILLYRELDIRDSLDRLIALRLAHPDYFPVDSDLPADAVEGSYAFVMEDVLPVWTKPGGGEQIGVYTRFTRVRAIAFAYSEGMLWACVIQPDTFTNHAEDYSKDGFCFVPANALHYSGDE